MSPASDPSSQAAAIDFSAPIALALSGGGYRAAAFHLGALAYLERLGLEPHITMLSTVSGGTFTGARYALSLVEGRTFQEFFAAFYLFLRDTDLLELGLRHLGRRQSQIPSGRSDLIISMAQVYAETFLGNGQGHPYLFGQLLDADIRLQEVVFNAADFRHGLAFRFQRSGNSLARIGNRMLHIPREEAAQLRLADIVAASSCFPGGFEPLAFPYDFAWPAGQVPSRLAEQFSQAGEPYPVGIMDGGTYDNQGIGSILLAEERDQQENEEKVSELGLFIISDVSQQKEDLYPFPASKGAGGLKLATVKWLLYGLAGICALTAGGVGYRLSDLVVNGGYRLFWDTFLLLVPFLLALTTLGLLLWVFRLFREEILPRVPQVGAGAWRAFRRLTTGQVKQMLVLRFSSVMALTQHIFMKHIRALIYAQVYQDERYEKKRVSNLIYHLNTANEDRFDKVLSQIPTVNPPTAQLRQVADVASHMPTQLWFDADKPFQQPCLVACGQFTLCYNLLKFIARHQGTDPGGYPPAVKEKWDRLVADWNRMVADPYALLQERLPGEISLVRPPYQ